MKSNWIERDGQVIDLPNFSSVIEKDGAWFVSQCPELGVASQGKTRTEAHQLLGEAVELWLEAGQRDGNQTPAAARRWNLPVVARH